MTSYTVQPTSDGEYLVSTDPIWYTGTPSSGPGFVWFPGQTELGNTDEQAFDQNQGEHDFYLQFNDYLHFDLSSVQGTIKSITLVLSNYEYFSPDSSERIQAFDVSTPTNQLLGGLPNGSTDTSIYNDLGSGTLYGSGSADSSGAAVSISLNSSALAAALANPTDFNIGLTMPDQTHMGETFVDNGGASHLVIEGVDVGTFSLIVTTNSAPVTAADSYSVDEDNTLVVSAVNGVLSNDTDPDTDPLTASLVSGPTHGSLTFNADGSFTYTPNANFHGTDSFTYKASDGELTSAETTASLTVNSVNDPPVIQSGGGGDTATYDVKVDFSAITTLSATDVDSGSNLSYSIVGGANADLFSIDSSTGELAFKVKPIVPHNGYDVVVQASDGSLTDQQAITVNVTSNKMVGDPAGADTFVFHSHFGSNSVNNFDVNNGVNHDFLQFDQGMFSADTAAAVLAAATDDHHGNTVISDLAGDHLVLIGVTKAALTVHPSDILFV